jgi:hypothetical protein
MASPLVFSARRTVGYRSELKAEGEAWDEGLPLLAFRGDSTVTWRAFCRALVGVYTWSATVMVSVLTFARVRFAPTGNQVSIRLEDVLSAYEH